MMNKASKRKTDSVYGVIAQGLLISLLICSAGAIIGTILLSKQIISESTVFITSVIIWAVAALGGSIFALNKVQSNHLLTVTSENICFMLILTGIGILFFDTNFKHILAAFLTIIAGSVVSILLFLNSSPKKNRKFHYKG